MPAYDHTHGSDSCDENAGESDRVPKEWQKSGSAAPSSATSLHIHKEMGPRALESSVAQSRRVTGAGLAELSSIRASEASRESTATRECLAGDATDPNPNVRSPSSTCTDSKPRRLRGACKVAPACKLTRFGSDSEGRARALGGLLRRLGQKRKKARLSSKARKCTSCILVHTWRCPSGRQHLPP